MICLKKQLKGALVNLLYRPATIRLLKTYKINPTNFSFTLRVLGLITKSITLRIALKATL